MERILYFIYFEEIIHWGPGDNYPWPYFSLTLNRQRNYTKFFSVVFLDTPHKLVGVKDWDNSWSIPKSLQKEVIEKKEI